jgi:phosphoenolpyruvate carboxykinase (GTP)
VRGLEDFTAERFYEAMSVDRNQAGLEVLRHEELFIKLYDRLPKGLRSVRDLLLSSLWRYSEC